MPKSRRSGGLWNRLRESARWVSSSARTLKIDAEDRALPLALDAIRKAGFDPQPVATAANTQGSQGRVFRIATMDCSAEEAEIRQALEPLDGIRSLGFSWARGR